MTESSNNTSNSSGSGVVAEVTKFFVAKTVTCKAFTTSSAGTVSEAAYNFQTEMTKLVNADLI